MVPSFRFFKKCYAVLTVAACFAIDSSFGQQLLINDSGYFEKPGVNVFVFSSQYNGMFFDEKTAGIELIHHGVRTATGGINKKDFKAISPAVSGFKIDGDVKDIKLITTAKNEKLILVAVNNDYMKVFRCRQKENARPVSTWDR